MERQLVSAGAGDLLGWHMVQAIRISLGWVWKGYLSICLLARSCLGAARPRCIVAPGVPLERIPPASPPRFSRVMESLHLAD